MLKLLVEKPDDLGEETVFLKSGGPFLDIPISEKSP